ncbi:serine hydrolase [SAR202 cluster bacterium AD-804-J14_MRT_500m]|nr:serine hydrolase [SAR202 cluster bacterium AD-804-J14_MRT_500m]
MKSNCIPIILIATASTLIMASCSGDNVREPDPTTVEASSELDVEFTKAVEEYIATDWGTWDDGENLGRCLTANVNSMTVETKQAVIKYGIEEAFNELSGIHVQSLSNVWDSCQTDIPTTATSQSEPIAEVKSSPTTQLITFESNSAYENFSDDAELQFKDAIDQHFDRLTEKAGISVAVYKEGYLWRYAKGRASPTENMKIGTPTLFRSSSKTFVAAIVLQQIDAGLYSLSDTLHSILSGNDDYESFDKNVINPDVTIHHLLTMTSGIADAHDYSRKEHTDVQTNPVWTPGDTVKLATRPFVSPGVYDYSNTNTMLLGMIVEEVAQENLNAVYKSQLFDPLGLIALLLPQDNAPPNTARPYGDRTNYGGSGFGDLSEASSWVTDWYESTGRTSWAAAGIVTTPENLAKWAYELFSIHGRAISSTSHAIFLDSFTDPMIEIGGWPQQYGYHATKRSMTLSNDDITVYGHPGGGGGYTSVFYYSPEVDLSISLLANSHSNARNREESVGRLTHRTLGDIGQRLFDIYKSTR